MRWEIHAHAEFTAAHALTSYRGEREPTHHHRWRLAIRVGASSLNEHGYSLDFETLHELVRSTVKPLDGSDLNQHPEIGVSSPTAERLAEVLAGWLRPEVERLGGALLAVSVWEGPENRVDLNLIEP